MEEVGAARPCDPVRGPKYAMRDADFASESLIQILSSAFESRIAGFRTLPADAPRRFDFVQNFKRNVNRSATAAPNGDRMPAS
jgi:hypothetical protein